MFKKIKEIFKDEIKDDSILKLNNSEWEKFQDYLNSKKEPSKELQELIGLKSFQSCALED